MKKLLGLLFVVSGLAQAAVPASRDIRLQLNIASAAIGGRYSVVTVDRHGYVFKKSCPLNPTVKCLPQPITRLTSREMDSIERDIDAARSGHIQRLPKVLCFAPPMFIPTYTADNGEILLASGDRCTGQKINVSPAAHRLVQKLNSLNSGRRAQGLDEVEFSAE